MENRERPVSLEEFAAQVQLTADQLRYWAFVATPETKWREFDIPKRNGAARHIRAPRGFFKVLLRRTYDVIGLWYAAPLACHGFVPERSILSNASVHSGARFVGNVDLADFFPSVNFGRVRGALMAHPMSLPRAVATTIAQMACADNELPQGSPLSPLLANLVCISLDNQLRRLARKFGCRYTRYADDMSFSTFKHKFPDGLLVGLNQPFGTEAAVGTELQRVVERNGFRINASKVRLYSRFHSQRVTGLIVNEFPNVPRASVRQIRAMIFAWHKFGQEKAESEHLAKFRPTSVSPTESKIFARVLKGKLSYLRMVKGPFDPVFAGLAARARELDPDLFSFRLHPEEAIEECLWIIESDTVGIQGTGFYLEGYGLITCAHVVAPDCIAYRYFDQGKRYRAELVRKNDHIDLAVLKLDINAASALKPNIAQKLQHHTPVLLAGFPNFAPGHRAFRQWGTVTALNTIAGVQRAYISIPIAGGASGSPLLNKKLQVVGVAVTGVDALPEAAKLVNEKFGVVPIRYLDQLERS